MRPYRSNGMGTCLVVVTTPSVGPQTSNLKITQFSTTWIELTIMFRVQTGYCLGGNKCDLALQADALRKMTRAIWSNAKHSTGGRSTTAKKVWRPGAFVTSKYMIAKVKAAVDHVANFVLSANADVDTLPAGAQADFLVGAVGLQVFSDGGHVQRRGAAAFVVSRIQSTPEGMESRLGFLMHSAASAFHAEVMALQAAAAYLTASM